MNTLDPMVSALIALCNAEGGEKFVADRAAVSAENLLQITKGVKLPSGNSRGVGPRLRARITSAYPNWLTPVAPVTAAPEQRQNSTTPPPLAQTLADLSAYLERFDAGDRAEAMRMISRLANEPEKHPNIALSVEAMPSTAFAPSLAKRA